MVTTGNFRKEVEPARKSSSTHERGKRVFPRKSIKGHIDKGASGPSLKRGVEVQESKGKGLKTDSFASLAI